LGVDRVDVCEAVEAMEEVGLVLPVEGANGRYLLARDPASISLAEVFTVFAADGLPLFLDGAVAGELAREATVNESELRTHSLADLVKPDAES
jgi:DNA-binding IscR family transcriptional regulator